MRGGGLRKNSAGDHRAAFASSLPTANNGCNTSPGHRGSRRVPARRPRGCCAEKTPRPRKLNAEEIRRIWPTLLPSFKYFADLRQTRAVHEHHAVHELHAVFCARGDHFFQVGGADPAGLFADDVLARRRRAQHPFLAQAGRQRDINRIHIGRREQLFIAAQAPLGFCERQIFAWHSSMN